MRNRNNGRIDGRGDVADTDGGFDERGDVADTDGIIQRGPGNALSNDNYTITGASEVLRKEAALNGASDSAAENVYELVVRYQKTGIDALKEKAATLLSALPPTSKVRLYIMLARDYYMKNVNNPDFKFFNAEKYLEKYTDVKNAAIDSGEKDLKAFALNHLLTRGIFEDRSSMTDFDPVKQIYANPSKFNEISLEDPALPEQVYNLYTK
ncbi:MAG: hypothetical protein K6E91_00325 [Butyrivibrio sp.]|nr:hypothetical protein [Butyrivibrio sp.]